MLPLEIFLVLLLVTCALAGQRNKTGISAETTRLLNIRFEPLIAPSYVRMVLANLKRNISEQSEKKQPLEKLEQMEQYGTSQEFSALVKRGETKETSAISEQVEHSESPLRSSHEVTSSESCSDGRSQTARKKYNVPKSAMKRKLQKLQRKIRSTTTVVTSSTTATTTPTPTTTAETFSITPGNTPDVFQNNHEKSDALLSYSHPLEYAWTYWYLNGQRHKSWEEQLVMLANFSTAEGFWAIYNHIPSPSSLPDFCDYRVFKEGIQPMWEAPQNADGGRWLITVNKWRYHDLLDVIWLEVLLAVIGQQFDEYNEDICGVVVNKRRNVSKISIWTKDANNHESIRKIGEILKQKLTSVDPKVRRPIFDALRYQSHQEVQDNPTSMKAKHVVTDA